MCGITQKESTIQPYSKTFIQREECKEKCVILDAQNHHRNLRRGRRKGMMKKVSFAMKKKQTERRACFVQRQFTYHHTTQLANACCSL